MRTHSRLNRSLTASEVLEILRRNPCTRRNAKTSSDPSEFVQIIDRAIFKGQKIYIWYTPASEGEEMRLVTPLAWKASKGNVLVTCVNGWGEVRTYRLDRITKVKEAFIDGAEHDTYTNMYDYDPNG